MIKPELGSKRICPETGRKFYDLNRDPIVSPYTGKSYPRSYFEDTVVAKIIEKEQEEEVEEVDVESPDVEIVPLDEVDEDQVVSPKSTKTSEVPDLDDDEDDVEIDDDDDTFLADDEDDDDDVSDIIGVNDDDDDI